MALFNQDKTISELILKHMKCS